MTRPLRHHLEGLAFGFLIGFAPFTLIGVGAAFIYHLGHP